MLPLSDTLVLDLTQVIAGPTAGQILGDMGADVIKVEPPEGDLLRLSGGSMGRDTGMGPIYMAANRNKRSLCLDLKKPRAVEILKGMIAKADLFIHNSRPAAIERLGLGYEELKKVNPSIVYAYSLGYARKGPYGHKPAFDDLVQGVSGAASLQSRVDGQPPKFMPSLIADKTTGLHLCIAVLAALYHRKVTGEGQMIEVPMLETLASFWLTEHLFGGTWKPERGTMGYDRIINKYLSYMNFFVNFHLDDEFFSLGRIKTVLFFLSARSDVPGGLDWVPAGDKLAHFLLYAVLGALLEARTGQQLASYRSWRLDTALIPREEAVLFGQERVGLPLAAAAAVAARAGAHEDQAVDARLQRLLGVAAVPLCDVAGSSGVADDGGRVEALDELLGDLSGLVRQALTVLLVVHHVRHL